MRNLRNSLVRSAKRTVSSVRLLSYTSCNAQRRLQTVAAFAAGQQRHRTLWDRLPQDVLHVARSTSRALTTTTEPREVMEYDVLIVGAGPAGLSAAIRLKQIASQSGNDLSVCVIEKGAEVGAHIISGNVFEPHALDELIPDWKSKGAPLKTEVSQDSFLFLTGNESHFKIPQMLMPASLDNHGNYIISLSDLVRWLGTQAEELGVEIYTGFAASEVLYGGEGPSRAVLGVATGDVGVGKDGARKDTFARGIELRARQTLLAEGCRGSCSEDVMAAMALRAGRPPQTYGIGLKEVWEVDPARLQPGLVQHSVGWPLDAQTYGGSFMYHMAPDRVLVGMVVGLDYRNPHLSPYYEFQRWKTHPEVRKHLEGGRCVSYGARALNEGGLQSIPKLTFPGGALIGCSAGFVNVAKIKGTHTAMKSGIVAAERVAAALAEQGGQAVAAGGSAGASPPLEVKAYQTAMEESWVWRELREVRNVHPAFHYGLLPGLAYSGLTLTLTGGREPWTLPGPAVPDHLTTGRPADHPRIDYPRPDGVLTFDILTNLARSGVSHEGDQPGHLQLRDEALAEWPAGRSLAEHGGPEARFCPARVYEYHEEAEPAAAAAAAEPAGAPAVPAAKGGAKLVINAQNCVHCKTCDIKTPGNFIRWAVPEGSGGPQYHGM